MKRKAEISGFLRQYLWLFPSPSSLNSTERQNDIERRGNKTDRELWTSWGHRRMRGLHEQPMVQTVLLCFPADIRAILNVLGPYQGRLKAQYWSLCQSWATPLIFVILWANCLDIWAFLNTANFLWGLSQPPKEVFLRWPSSCHHPMGLQRWVCIYLYVICLPNHRLFKYIF